jgi:hypothetical protein
MSFLLVLYIGEVQSQRMLHRAQSTLFEQRELRLKSAECALALPFAYTYLSIVSPILPWKIEIFILF